MKKILLILLILSSLVNADNSEQILVEIKQLRIDMNKRFEQVDKRFEQVDKRFELMQSNMDKRFDQVDKRFDTVFNILYILMGLVFASPFIAIYLKDRRDEKDRILIDQIRGVVVALRELAQDDPKVRRSLDVAGL